MNKILVIALGGTIGSIKKDHIGLDCNNLKILEYCNRSDVEFDGISPFSVLSENMSIDLWQILFDCLKKCDFEKYKGVVILHGSDTLAFTSALVYHGFGDKNIVLTASDKPIEDAASNGIDNFNKAVEHIINHQKGVYVSYDGIFEGNSISGADVNDCFRHIPNACAPIMKNNISNKNILIIRPYVNIDYSNYRTDKLDGVLIEMYHSATYPQNTKEFVNQLNKECIPCFFVTHKSSIEYETAIGTENIIFNSTTENAYATLILE